MQIVKFVLYLLFSILFVLKSITSIKPELKNEIKSDDIKNNPLFRKDCKIEEKCRECTFFELKNLEECQVTGYKLIKHCILYNDIKAQDEYYQNEHCNEISRINTVFYFLFLNLFLLIISAYIRTSHKRAILSNTFEKLTILRRNE